MSPLPRRFCALLIAARLAVAPALAGQGPTSVLLAPGDRILLAVDGEPQLSDTFAVEAGPVITLPGIGAVTLAGVPRDHVEPYLAGQLARFLTHPVVHARALVRVGALGEVERPGYYAVPADAQVSDVLMAAGGLTREARFEQMRVERNGATLWSGSALRRAITAGTSLDALGVQAGDVVLIPRRRDSESVFRIVGIAVTIPLAVYAITRIGQ